MANKTLNPCPFCGGNPRIKKSQYAVSKYLDDAYLVQCGKCWARTLDAVSEEQAAEYWSERKFTPETIILSKPFNSDTCNTQGAMNMITELMDEAANDYMAKVRTYAKNPNSNFARAEKETAERFYYRSPFIRIMGLDPDNIVHTLNRKAGEMKDGLQKKNSRHRKNNGKHK